MKDFDISDYTKRTTSPVPGPQRSQMDELEHQIKVAMIKLAESTTMVAKLQVALEQQVLAHEKLRQTVLNMQLAIAKGKRK